jgi:hypothetical protein
MEGRAEWVVETPHTQLSFCQAALDTVMAGCRAGQLSPLRPAVKALDSTAFAAMGGRP